MAITLAAAVLVVEFHVIEVDTTIHDVALNAVAAQVIGVVVKVIRREDAAQSPSKFRHVLGETWHGQCQQKARFQTPNDAESN